MKLLSVPLLMSLMIFAACSKDDSPTQPAPTFSSEKAITSFSFLKKDNPALENDITATITGQKVTAEIPGNITGRNLIPAFTISAKAKVKVGGAEQVSGQTKNNFSNTVTYEVEAEDNSKVNYTVEVKILGSAPAANINATTAQALHNANFIWTDLSTVIVPAPSNVGWFSDRFAGRTFYDFDKDGDNDLIVTDINFGQFGDNVPIDILYFKNNNGVFQKDISVFGGNIPKYVHGRQIILGDYDKNGWMDVVIIGHGWDKEPFPGEKQKILLNNNGVFTTKELPIPNVQNNTRLPFTHSGTSGDVDNDGDLDIFMTNNMGINGIFLINDGSGNFTYNSTVFPSIEHKPYFTSNMYDLNADGYLDLVIAGHDQDMHLTAANGAKPAILWGSFDGKFSLSRITYLPVVSKNGVSNSINFIDYDKDGKMDILIGKTGDGSAGSNSFYQGWYLQLLKNNGGTSFTDVSSAIQNNSNTSEKWVAWFLVKDIDNDGDQDIVSDDKSINLQWRNNNGTFQKF